MEEYKVFMNKGKNLIFFALYLHINLINYKLNKLIITKMKNRLYLFIMLCCLLAGCKSQQQSPDSFTLTGQIGELDAPAKIYFSYFWEGIEHRDSALLDKGHFSFTGAITAPAASRLILDYTGEGMIPAGRAGNEYYLYLEPGTIKLKSPDSLQNIKFIKSPINDEHLHYLAHIGGLVQDLAKPINAKYAAATPEQQKDMEFITALNEEYSTLLNKRTEMQQKYVREHPNSFFSVVAISESYPISSNLEAEKIDEIESLFLSINEKYREMREGKSYAQQIFAAKNIGVGKEALDFTQNDPDGKPIKLSDFRGKYLLLDFWASWCGPCRQENPNLVKAYAKYKDKGFEILGVSLDKPTDKQAWLDAIEKDELTWPQVSDGNNGAAKMYGVRSIPHNHLLDPNGIILASNLRGNQLEEFLSQLFQE